MIGFKPGVKIHGMVPQIAVALTTMNYLYERAGVNVIVTSGVDGKHKRQSAHYTGRAVDLRISNLPPSHPAGGIVSEAQELLGIDFDVILEGDHIHLEWDPKENG